MQKLSDLRIASIAIAAIIVSPLTLAMYGPSMPSMATSLATSPGMIQLTLTVYLVAFALSQLLYGPISDRYGRRPVILAGLSIYIAGCALAWMATTIEIMIVARIIEGIGACGGSAASRALVRDCRSDVGVAKIMSIIGMGLGVAPAAGPIIAGYLQVRYGWPAIFVALAAIAGAILLFVALAMPETNLRRDPAATRWRSVTNNYWSIASDRRFVSYVAVLALTTAGTYSFIAAAPFVLISKLGLTPDRFGTMMPLLVVAYFLAAAVTTKLLGPVSPDRLVKMGIGVAAVVALALFGLAQAGVLTVAVALAAMMLWMVGIALLTPGVTSGALQPFPASAGTAAALMGFAQMLGGGIGSAVSAMLGADPEPIFGLAPACFALLGALIYGLLLGRMAKMGSIAS